MLWYKDKPRWRKNLEDGLELLMYLMLAVMIIFGVAGFIIGSLENHTCHLMLRIPPAKLTILHT